MLSSVKQALSTVLQVEAHASPSVLQKGVIEHVKSNAHVLQAVTCQE